MSIFAAIYYALVLVLGALILSDILDRARR